MRKNLGKCRKCCSFFCMMLLIGSLLLTSCASRSGDQSATQPTNATKDTKAPDTTETTQSVHTTPTADATPTTDITIPIAAPEDPSVVIFRQAMVGTPQIFAAAFFGYVPQDADPLVFIQEAAPQLCEDLPFLLTIDQDHILGVGGQLFCIVPADENATVAVNRRPWNAETQSYEEPEVLYRSESGAPILLMCPNEDWIPDTELVITDSSGTVTIWSPYLDPSYRISSVLNDNGESLIFDFTSYDELAGF